MRCPAAAERDRALLTVSAAGPRWASSHASPPVPAGWATGNGGSPAPRMRPAPAGSSHGAAAGGFARRGRSRTERGRQPALPTPARPDGVGWRRAAPGEASTGGRSGPVCKGIKRGSARTAAADRGGRGGSHGTGAAGRNAGETGVRACEWSVCESVRVCVCALMGGSGKGLERRRCRRGARYWWFSVHGCLRGEPGLSTRRWNTLAF